MRVGFIAGEYPPMQGGVGAFTREVAREMANTGHKVFVFTRTQVQIADEDGISIYPVVGDKWGWNTIPRIKTWIAENQIEIINIQFQTAAFNMHPAIHWTPHWIKSVPVVVTFHDLRIPYLFPKAGPIRDRIVKKIARDADAVISTDREDEARLRQTWHIPNVCWIPIGSNVTTTPPPQYDRQAFRAQLGVGDQDLLISYFGFLNESKGGLVLVEALAYLVEQGIPAHLVMIGGRAGSSDPTNVRYGERVDALIDKHNLSNRVHWTGFVEDDMVSANFLASDLTALPYLDGVSLRRGTLMAALAHGRAIITTHPETDAPELEDVVKTVPPANPDALAGAILSIWHDPKKREQLERAAKQTNDDHFTWSSITRQTIEYFNRLFFQL